MNTKITYVLQTTEMLQTDGMVDLPEVNNTNDNNTTNKTYKDKDTQDISEVNKNFKMERL